LFSISIIGSGLGGISAAIRLACKGYNVTVYEKNSEPGGKAGEINNSGFRFDTGPSLLTMPFVIEELFASAGEKMSEHLTLNKLDNLCRYFYPGGTVLNASSDPDKFGDEINRLTTDSKETLHGYLDYCRTIYELTSDIFLFKDLYSLETYSNLKALKTLFKFHKIDPFRTMDTANRSFFKDERIIQLFNRYATYNGSNPYKCPATLNIIPHVECNIGGYFISGGMHRLTEELFALAKRCGVIFRFGSNVEKIISEGRVVKGIELEGGVINSDAVVSNADVYSVYAKLLDDNYTKAAKKYNNLEPSSSALVFYWGVDITSGKLDTHNILFSSDYKKEFSELFDKKIYPEDPTVYIYISSKFSKGDAPPGKENWFVMINAPNTQLSPPERGRLRGGINEIKETILTKIKSLTGYDIKDKIIYENIMTPVDIESQTGSYGGSIYGISSNNRKAAFLRQPNRSKHYKGLYFCGGSAHPGGGIPLVILSGKLAAENIIKNRLQSPLRFFEGGTIFPNIRSSEIAH
jgi:phytoene desaturase